MTWAHQGTGCTDLGLCGRPKGICVTLELVAEVLSRALLRVGLDSKDISAYIQHPSAARPYLERGSCLIGQRLAASVGHDGRLVG